MRNATTTIESARNPFVGLRPFNTDESLLFFGRHQQTVELIEQLHRTHFIGVVGSSGCGKSSLIRAGLIPKLKAGFLVKDRDQWRIAVMKPGDAPIANLAAALSEAIPVNDDAFADTIRTGGVQAVIERLAPQLTSSNTNLLLLVDQFEEIFRFGIESGRPEQRDVAEDFVSIMLGLSEQRQLPIYVVMTMRSDFLGDCDNFYGLPEAMNRSQYLVPRLARRQRQQAIEGPIRLFGASIAPRLLDRVLNDAGDQSDQLPVMQHALMRTWERWRRSGDFEAIDLQHYEAIGMIKDALSRDEDAALEGMSEEELKITERMFRALTDTDARNRHIRRPAHLSEIADITGADREKILEIIERFRGKGRSFLTVTDDADPLVDISHESLIRQWGRMSDWVEAEAESREMYLRVADAAALYQRLGNEDLLWKGTQLELALEWLDKDKPNAAWADRYRGGFEKTIDFLKLSEQVRDAEMAKENRRRKRSQQIAWSVASVIIVLLLALVVFGWFAALRDNRYRQEIYESDIKLAEEEFKNSHYSRVIDMLSRYLPERLLFFQRDVRDERWRILWRVSHDEFVTLKSHESGVSSVAFSPDGKMLASASEDRTVKLWDVASRQNLATLTGHQSPVNAVALSPDGLTLASASSDRMVKLWDVASRQNLVTLNGHEGGVWSVAFSPDGKMLATASEDQTVKLWDLASRQNLATLTGHESVVRSVAFSPDGKTLASAGSDETVKLWDLASRQNLATLKGHESVVRSVAFSPDGRTLASASEDQTVKLWDLASRRNLATLIGHDSIVRSVAFSPDGKTLASASDDQTVKLWNVDSHQNLATLKGYESIVRSVAFSPDARTLASSSSDQTVRLWDVASRQSLATLKGHERGVKSVAVSPDGRMLATASPDKTVKLWDLASRQNLATLTGHESWVNAVAFSPDGRTLASASDDRYVRLWDAASRQNLATLKGHERGVWSVAFSPDGRTLATASEDQTVKLWDVASHQNLATLTGHESVVRSVAFSPDGRMLASANEGQTVKLWDVASRQNLATLTGHDSIVRSVAFSPDGRILASASDDRTVKLWDVASRQNIAALKGHESGVWSVAFSPDGGMLASAGSDQTVKLWDVASRQNLATLKGHESVVRSVAFSPDGKTLISASDDRTVKLWDLGSSRFRSMANGALQKPGVEWGRAR